MEDLVAYARVMALRGNHELANLFVQKAFQALSALKQAVNVERKRRLTLPLDEQIQEVKARGEVTMLTLPEEDRAFLLKTYRKKLDDLILSIRPRPSARPDPHVSASVMKMTARVLKVFDEVWLPEARENTDPRELTSCLQVFSAKCFDM